MTDEVRIRQMLAEILESPEFKESHRYRDLLQYLVEESIAGRIPKETSIGMQVFGKDASFNSKEDASVRVYINNLRKKLEHYYLTSDKPHVERLNIPVGHYKVEIVTGPDRIHQMRKRSHPLAYALVAIGMIVSFFFGYYVSQTPKTVQSVTKAPNPIWDDFIKPNGRPTLIVVGDYFFLRERGKPGTYVRLIRINTPEDYRQALAEDPDFAKKYEQSDFTFLRPSSLYGITQFLPILRSSSNGVSIKLASQFTIVDFKSNNVIFIGPLKTLFSFQKFVHIFKFDYSLTPPTLRIHGDNGDTLHEFAIGDQRGGTYEKDFAVITKGAGPEGSTILMLTGFAETGTIEAASAACNPQLFHAVSAKFPVPTITDPFYFTLVIAAEGMTQAIFNSDIRYFVQNKPPLDLSDTKPRDSNQVR